MAPTMGKKIPVPFGPCNDRIIRDMVQKRVFKSPERSEGLAFNDQLRVTFSEVSPSLRSGLSSVERIQKMGRERRGIAPE
ncbi:MAG: hypothetical protein ACKO26_09460 [Planctomycetota bacterium]